MTPTGLATAPGVPFFVHSLVSYAVLLVGAGLVVVGIRGLDARNKLAGGVAVVLPFAGNALALFGGLPVVLTPTAVAVAAALLSLPVSRGLESAGESGESVTASGWESRVR